MEEEKLSALEVLAMKGFKCPFCKDEFSKEGFVAICRIGKGTAFVEGALRECPHCKNSALLPKVWENKEATKQEEAPLPLLFFNEGNVIWPAYTFKPPNK